MSKPNPTNRSLQIRLRSGLCKTCTIPEQSILRFFEQIRIRLLFSVHPTGTRHCLNLLPEISDTTSCLSELLSSRAHQALVACAMIRSGYPIGQIAGLIPGMDESGLPKMLHRMISDIDTESWLRTNLIRHEQEIQEAVEALLGKATGRVDVAEDEILERFNSIAMSLSGKGVGEAPDAEIELLEVIDLNFEKVCLFLTEPLSRERVQASLWLRDLASFPRVLPTMNRRNQAARLIRLRLKLAIPPRRQGSALLSIPLLMDLQPNH